MKNLRIQFKRQFFIIRATRARHTYVSVSKIGNTGLCAARHITFRRYRNHAAILSKKLARFGPRRVWVRSTSRYSMSSPRENEQDRLMQNCIQRLQICFFFSHTLSIFTNHFVSDEVSFYNWKHAFFKYRYYVKIKIFLWKIILKKENLLSNVFFFLIGISHCERHELWTSQCEWSVILSNSLSHKK